MTIMPRPFARRLSWSSVIMVGFLDGRERGKGRWVGGEVCRPELKLN